MKSPVPRATKETREDVSDYLWHFCREDRNPEETICSILHDKQILPSKDGTSGERVVCFTEMPLEQAKRQMKVLRENEYTRFSSYGIGFLKSFIFERGGLPVIYEPPSALKDLPSKLKWRHVDFDLSNDKGLDYTWQREWRIKGNLDFSDACDHAIVVVPEERVFVDSIFNVEPDGDVIDGVMETFPSYTRIWKSISMDWIDDPITDNSIRISSERI